MTRSRPSIRSGDGVTSLGAMLVVELQEAYGMERQLRRDVPRLIGRVRTPALVDALRRQHAQTAGHVGRIHTAFALLSQPPRVITGFAISGLLVRPTAAARAAGVDVLRDAAVLASLRHVCAHKVATYLTLFELAIVLEAWAVAALLRATLDEEEGIEQLLAHVAREEIHPRAVGGAGWVA